MNIGTDSAAAPTPNHRISVSERGLIADPGAIKARLRCGKKTNGMVPRAFRFASMMSVVRTEGRYERRNERRSEGVEVIADRFCVGGNLI